MRSLLYGDALYRDTESMAVQGHKDMLVTSSLDDVMLTSAFTGLPASKLRPSIVAAGRDPDALLERGMIDITKTSIRTNGPNVGRIFGPPDIPHRA